MITRVVILLVEALAERMLATCSFKHFRAMRAQLGVDLVSEQPRNDDRLWHSELAWGMGTRSLEGSPVGVTRHVMRVHPWIVDIFGNIRTKANEANPRDVLESVRRELESVVACCDPASCGVAQLASR